jgi:hypothetical protein
MKDHIADLRAKAGVPAAAATAAPAAKTPAVKPAPAGRQDPASLAAAKVAAAASAKAVDGAATGTPEAQAAAERHSSNLARVKREEARLFAEKQKFETAQKDFQVVQKEALRRAAAFDNLGKLAKTDPLKYLEAAGIKFEDLAKKVIKGDERTVAEQVQAAVETELKKFQAERAELDRRSAQKAQDESIASQIRAAQDQLRELAGKDQDKYEFVNSDAGNIALVWNLIEAYHEQTVDPKTGMGKILDFTEALDTIEESLEKQQLDFVSKSKKVKAAFEKQALAAKQAALPAQNRGRDVPKSSAVQKPPDEVATPEIPEARAPKKGLGINDHIRDLIARHKARLDS